MKVAQSQRHHRPAFQMSQREPPAPRDVQPLLRDGSGSRNLPNAWPRRRARSARKTRAKPGGWRTNIAGELPRERGAAATSSGGARRAGLRREVQEEGLEMRGVLCPCQGPAAPRGSGLPALTQVPRGGLLRPRVDTRLTSGTCWSNPPPPLRSCSGLSRCRKPEPPLGAALRVGDMKSDSAWLVSGTKSRSLFPAVAAVGQVAVKAPCWDEEVEPKPEGAYGRAGRSPEPQRGGEIGCSVALAPAA